MMPTLPQKYKVTLAYDGTPYSGWQVQPNAISIQGSLEQALKLLLKEEIRVVGAGRTDAGVHALGQVAHFTSSVEFSPYRLQHSLNGLLPNDIRILEVKAVAPEFHAQISAERKTYHYHFWLEPIFNPFLYRYRFTPRPTLDIPLMMQAARLFEGRHDFTSFINAGTVFRSPVRSVYRSEIIPQEGGVRFEIEGNGFLYKMVRNIAGMLVAVASGKREISDIALLFEKRDRKLAPLSLPAQGLFLVKIDYPASF